MAAVLFGTCASAADEKIGVEYRFPDDVDRLSPDERSAARSLWRSRCRVTALSAIEQEAFRAAASHVADVLRDASVRKLIQGKRDWVVPRGARWIRDAAAGLRALEKLTAGALAVGVLGYGRGPDLPCDTPVGSERIHAFAAVGSAAILVHRAWLDRQANAPDSASGRRQLARTLVHETMHAPGYEHPETVGDIAYNNTIPAFFGCLVLTWPDPVAAAACALPDSARPRSRFEWDCDPAGAARELRAGQAVWVKVGRLWADAEVQAVDVPNGRADVVYGLDGTADQVGACRVRACLDDSRMARGQRRDRAAEPACADRNVPSVR